MILSKSFKTQSSPSSFINSRLTTLLYLPPRVFYEDQVNQKLSVVNTDMSLWLLLFLTLALFLFFFFSLAKVIGTEEENTWKNFEILHSAPRTLSRIAYKQNNHTMFFRGLLIPLFSKHWRQGEGRRKATVVIHQCLPPPSLWNKEQEQNSKWGEARTDWSETWSFTPATIYVNVGKLFISLNLFSHL